MKKVLIYSFLSLALLGLAGVSIVSAQTQNGQYSPIIQKIAEKFNLNADEVKAVFNTQRQEMMKNRLRELGITQEQADTLKTKQEELRNQFGDPREMSLQER